MLIQDRDFACTPRNCYGIGQTDVLFRQFQRAINNAASLVRVPGWKSISQDGKISTEVIQGLLAIAERARGPALEAFLQAPVYSTAAQLVPELMAELTQVQPVMPTRMPPPSEPPQAAEPATHHAMPTQAAAPATPASAWTQRETPVAAMPSMVPSPMALAPQAEPTAPAPAPTGGGFGFQKPAYMLAQSKIFSKVPWILGGVAALGAITAVVVAATSSAHSGHVSGGDDGDEGGDEGGGDDAHVIDVEPDFKGVPQTGLADLDEIKSGVPASH